MDLKKGQFRFFDLVFDPTSGELCRGSHRIRLPEKPLLALSLLLEHANEVVSRQDLCRRLWPAGTFVEFDENLNATIKRLRELLHDSAESPRIIETVPRSGYRFIAPIELPSPVAATIPAPTPQLSSAKQTRLKSWLSKWAGTVGLAGIPVFVALALVLNFEFDHVRGLEQRPPSRRPVKLAVARFDNRTGDSGRNFLSDGLSEGVARRLRNLAPESLTIISYESTWKSPTKSDLTLVQDTGADYVLSGALESQNGNLLLTTELTEAHASTPRWRAIFRLPTQEIFVERDLADRVRRMLSLQAAKPNGLQPSHECTSNTTAYEAYLRGREALLQDGGSTAQEALAWFDKALTADRSFALPYAGMAGAYLRMGRSHSMSPEKSEEKAEQFIAAGTALDSRVADFALLRAEMISRHFGRDREVDLALRQAVELDPDNAMAHAQYALFLRERLPERALPEITEARNLDPLSPRINAYAGAVLISAGKLDAADHQLQIALSLDPHLPVTLNYLGVLEEDRGQMQRAIGWYEKAVAASNRNSSYLYRLALAYARSGRDLETKAALEELRGKSAREFVDPRYINDLQSLLGGG